MVVATLAWACHNRGMSDSTDASATPDPVQPRNPLHGVTLQALLQSLVDYYGWEGLAQRIPVRCFSADPSVSSSLKFLRKTPWAREKVEGLYLATLRAHTRQQGRR